MIGVRIAIYARFSSDKQSDASIEDQVHRAREWIRAQGGDPDRAEIITDFAISGASMDRPGMRTLEEAVRRRSVDMVVTESVDRISRDVEDAARFRKLITHHEVELACLDGTRVSPGGKSDALMFGMRALFAEQYRLDLADKTRRGLEGRARKGAPTGIMPYGFRIETAADGTKTIVIDPERAAVVRRIFAMYKSGQSLATIAETLNREGVTPPRAHSRRSGNGWMHSAVRAMLLNERYIGRWSYGEREWVKLPGTNIRRPRARRGGALVTFEHPDLALVDPTTWAAVQARFQRNPVMPAKKRTFLLSGILHCGACEGRMQFSGGSSRPYFACSTAQKRRLCDNRRNVPVVAVEAGALEAIRTTLTGCIDEVRDRVAQRLAAWASSIPDRRVVLKQQIADCARKLANLIDLAAMTGSSTVAARIRELEAQRAALQLELAVAEGPTLKLPSPDELVDRVLALEKLVTRPPDEAREALRACLDQGRIYCSPADERSVLLRGGLLPEVILFAPTTPERRKPSSVLPEDGRWTMMVAGAGFADSIPLYVPCFAEVA